MKFTHIKPEEWAYDSETNTIYYDGFVVWKPCEGSEIIRSELCKKNAERSAGRSKEGIMVPMGYRGGVMEPLCWQEVCRKDGAK